MKKLIRTNSCYKSQGIRQKLYWIKFVVTLKNATHQIKLTFYTITEKCGKCFNQLNIDRPIYLIMIHSYSVCLQGVCNSIQYINQSGQDQCISIANTIQILQSCCKADMFPMLIQQGYCSLSHQYHTCNGATFYVTQSSYCQQSSGIDVEMLMKQSMSWWSLTYPQQPAYNTNFHTERRAPRATIYTYKSG